MFIWTTGQKFSRAVELNDLLGTSDADDALWGALKSAGIGAERQIVVHDARARYRVDFWISCAYGNVAILIGDTPRRMPKGKSWRTVQFAPSNLIGRQQNCIAQIRKLVRELGSAKYSVE